jgi:hypothetical protein
MDKMTVEFSKFVSSLCLSIMLINAGAAWALQDCLMRGEEVGHVHWSNGELPFAGRVIDHPYKPDAKIHCPENHILNLSFGPASSIFRLEPLVENSAASLNADAPILIDGLLDGTILKSINPHWSPYLFLSKLRI